VKKVRHDGPDYRLASVIGRHRHDAAKDLDRASVPEFGHIVQRCKSRIDEGPQVPADCLAPVPLCHAEAADGVFREAVKTAPKGFVVDFLPEIQKPLRRCGFLEGQCSFLIFFCLHVSFPFVVLPAFRDRTLR